MTLDEFLDDYVPRVLKPMGFWFLSPRGIVLRDSEEEWCCPITATRDRSFKKWEREARWLGLNSVDTDAITVASDNALEEPEYNAAIRARLLAGLGLTESTIYTAAAEKLREFGK